MMIFLSKFLAQKFGQKNHHVEYQKNIFSMYFLFE